MTILPAIGSPEPIGTARQQLYRRGKIGGSIPTTCPRLPSKMFITIMAAPLVPVEDGKSRRFQVRTTIRPKAVAVKVR
jgi:hypothetical protein